MAFGKQSSSSFIDFPRECNHPALTLNSLIHSLRLEETLSSPPRRPISFDRLLLVENPEDLAGLDDKEARSRSCLIVCEGSLAEDVSHRAGGFLLVLCDEESAETALSTRALKDRSVIVKKKGEFSRYSKIVTSAMLKSIFWQNDLDRIVYAAQKLDNNLTSTIRSLMRASEDTIRFFVSVTDNGGNLLASMNSSDSSAMPFSGLLRNGCFSAEEREFIKGSVLAQNIPQNTLFAHTSPDGTAPCLYYPIYIDNVYYFLVCVSCPDPSSKIDFLSCKDEAGIFLRRLRTICSKYWKEREAIESPWHQLLRNLIEDAPMSREFFASQISLTNLGGATQYRLFLIEYAACKTTEQRSEIIEIAKKMNSGQCHLFAYKEDLLVLCHFFSQEGRGEVLKSHIKFLSENIYEAYGVQSVFSPLFDDITDIKFAYQQTCVAKKWRMPLLDLASHSPNQGNPAAIPFEHVFPFYLVDSESADKALVDYTFAHGIVGNILQRDRDDGTEMGKLLWVYISNNNSLATAARLMHMHKNTVLYNIKKIEKTYGISLKDDLVKSRVIVDFYYFFGKGLFDK